MSNHYKTEKRCPKQSISVQQTKLHPLSTKVSSELSQTFTNFQ